MAEQPVQQREVKLDFDAFKKDVESETKWLEILLCLIIPVRRFWDLCHKETIRLF